jgi:hypothetical protein
VDSTCPKTAIVACIERTEVGLPSFSYEKKVMLLTMTTNPIAKPIITNQIAGKKTWLFI